MMGKFSNILVELEDDDYKDKDVAARRWKGQGREGGGGGWKRGEFYDREVWPCVSSSDQTDPRCSKSR